MRVTRPISLRWLSMATFVVAVTGTMACAQTIDPRQVKRAPARPAAAKAVKPVKPPAAARIAPRVVPPVRAIGTAPAGRLPARPAPSLPARTATTPPKLLPGTRPPLGAAVNVPGAPPRAAITPGRIVPGPLPGGATRPGALPPGGAAARVPNSPAPLRSPRTNVGALPPAGAPNARVPASGLRQSSLPRPGAALPRPGVTLPRPGMGLPRPTAALPRGAGRFGGSPTWTAMRQRYYVAPPRSVGPPPGIGIGRTRHEMAYSGVPPRDEVRFVTNEVVVQVANTVPRAQVETVARQLGIAMVATHGFDAAGRTLYQFRSSNGRDVRDVIRQLEQNNIVAAAQPNYVYQFVQNAPPAALPPRMPASSLPPPAAPSAAATAPMSLPPRALPAGDPSQYSIEKLHLGEVHRLARGRNVAIAVIDSEIDERHPDLQGAHRRAFRSLRPTQSTAHPRHRHGRCHRRQVSPARSRAGREHPCHQGVRRQAARRRSHQLPDPQRPRLRRAARRAHHQHELCRPLRRDDRAQAARGL